MFSVFVGLIMSVFIHNLTKIDTDENKVIYSIVIPVYPCNSNCVGVGIAIGLRLRVPQHTL